MFDTIFERILNALSFDKAVIDLHSKYATNFAYTFLLWGFVKHNLFVDIMSEIFLKKVPKTEMLLFE